MLSRLNRPSRTQPSRRSLTTSANWRTTLPPNVAKSAESLTKYLTSKKIPHAFVGGVALNAHGYGRATQDLDILLTRSSHSQFLTECLGRGHGLTRRNKFTERWFRDNDNKVDIDLLISGEYPGDGLQKPVAFPDPSLASEVIDDLPVIRLPALVNLKLASGLTQPSRLKDLSDVQELIRAVNLPRSFVTDLDPYVKAEYLRLWDSVDNSRQKQGEPPKSGV